MKNRVQEVIDKAITAQSMSHLCMMLGSAFAANQAVFLKMQSEGYEVQTAALCAVGVAVIVAGFVDGTLKGWLPFTIASFVGKKDRKTGVERYAWFNWAVRLLTVTLLFVTTYLNVGLTPDIVDSTIGTADTSQQDSRTNRALSRYEKDLAIYEAEKNEATQYRSDLERNKKANTAALISEKSNSKVAALWAKGNSWVYESGCAGCASAIRSAQKQINKEIAAAKEAEEKAKAALSAFMATTGKATDEVLLSANTEISELNTENRTKKTTWTGLMMTIMIISTVVFIGSTLVIVLYEEETGEDVSRRATVANISKNAFFKAKNWVLQGIVNRSGLDKFTHAPTLAGVGSFPVIAPTQSYTEQKVRKSENNTESQKTTQKCKSGKCEPKQKKQVSDNDYSVRETRDKTESDYTEQQTQQLTGRNAAGDEWPTPVDKDNWDKLVKRARGWAEQSIINPNDNTRERNATRWDTFVEYAGKFNYRAGISEEGKAYCNNDPEPIWSEDGNNVYFGVADDSDFDVPYND